jgi:hypothetical protein
MDSKGQWPAPGVGHTHGWEMSIVVWKFSWSVEWLLCSEVRSCGVAGVSHRRGCLFEFGRGFVLVEPVFLFHKFLKELFKNSVRTSKRTPHFTITKINWLTLFKFNPLKPKLI